ncbi:hypothetical protein [Nocardioides sp. J54]|uniref:hypothetical protein n=1 Tax=Nocardioides sp. J54 TaxID=935866 RepID=UPI00048C202A|nr:hypothetical protein [Nocardioides sp. J54]
MSLHRIASLLSLTALAAASVLPAVPASAAPEPASTTVTAATGSIVLVRGHNVWLTRPDGTGARAVTGDGTAASPYEHPTMSDSGVIAVRKGSTFVRMRQDGTVLNRMTPRNLFLRDSDTVSITPVLDPEISPDGTKIAYSQVRLQSYSGRLVSEALTGVTDATGWVGPDRYGIVEGWQPSWVTKSRLVLNVDGDVHLADLGKRDVAWFRSGDLFGRYIELGQPEVSRDGTRVLFGASDHGVVMKTSVGDPRTGTPAPPTATPDCAITPDEGEVGAVDPSFGPDGDSAAYSEDGDLWVVRGLAACGPGTTITRIVAGGSQPDWSPAPLSAPRRTFTLARVPKVTGKAVVGKRLRASAGTWSPSPARVAYTWLRNGKVVKGRTTATYQVGRADRGKKIKVRVTVRRSGYVARTATSKAVRVRR